MRTSRFLLAVALSLATGVAFAQSVTSVTGDAMVQAEGSTQFVTATDANVQVGDTIMVPQGETLTITYSDGTQIRFNPGTYTVPSAAEAAAMSSSVAAGTFVNAGLTAAIIGGVVVLSAVALDEMATGGDDDTDDTPPTSP